LLLKQKKIAQIVALALLLADTGIPLRAANDTNLSAQPSLGERRKSALEAARAGQFDAPIATFAELVKLAPNDIGIKADQIVVLSWAKKPQEAVTAAADVDIKTLPTYGLKALARAARDIGQTSLAINYYDELSSRDTSNLDPVFGKILTLTDAKRFDEAQAELIKLREQYPNNAEVYRTLAYLGTQSKQPVLAIDANTRLLEMNHQDLDAARALIRAAREAGATPQALALAKQYPEAVDHNEIVKIHNDSAAQYIAWNHYNSKMTDNAKLPAQRFSDVDKALLKLDEACQCDWNGLDLSQANNQNLMFDRILALRDRYRMQEAMTSYQQLVKANIDPQAYVLNAAGDAYLYMRMPEEALKAYDASLVKAPDNVETKFSKFHTLIELEQFDEATKLIDGVAQSYAAYRTRPKNPIIRPQEYKLEADRKAFYARAYGDNLATAEQQFQALNNIGPMNNEVRLDLAEVWRWRGWPERAEARFAEVNRDYPDQLEPRAGLANSHLDLRDWQLAESEIVPLVKEYPENASVQELDKRWQQRNERQLAMDVYSNRSTGSTFGSRTQGLNGVLYSNPIHHNYRAFVSTQYEHATFPEGTGNVFYPGIGLEYTNRDWRMTGEINKASLANIGVGAKATAEYRLDDYWSFSALAAVNSSQMPLRGLITGISGDLLSADATYRWSELTTASAGASYMHMEDGNNRESVNLTLDRRLITKPHYKLTTHVRLDASHNTEANAIYFNPQRDLEVGAILDNEWMLWRRYDRSFSHRLQLGAGEYWQKNFGSDLTWLLSYEQQVRWDNGFEVDYGVSRSRHPYDGTNEVTTQFFARLNVLF
jgi:biofilm PGA synthesis protein PgaA